MVCSLIYLVKELVIQKIRLSFEKRLFEKQIKAPDGVGLLCRLVCLASPDKEQDPVRAEILSAFETEQQTINFAEELYKNLAPKGTEWGNFSFGEESWARYGLSVDTNNKCKDFEGAVLRIRKESYGATDVVRAIDDLNGLCWLVVLVLWAVTAGKQVTMPRAQ